MSTDTWLPNLFILGVPKAGTTSLHDWLVAHPDVKGPISKEASFFIDPESHVFRPDFNMGLGLELYRSEFVEGGARVILDATPTYIFQRTALEHIPTLPSHPRCLVLVRDPAEQIFSLYRYFRDNWNDVPPDMSFDAFIRACEARSHDFGGNELLTNALENADYVRHLRPWRAALGPDRLMVRSLDEMRADPRAFTISVAQWIGVDPGFFESFTFARENETFQPFFRGLQRLNIAVRGYLPKGAAYTMARKIYRKMNLKRQAVAPEEAAVLEKLRAQFEQANAELARDYGVDVTSWQPRGKPHSRKIAS